MKCFLILLCISASAYSTFSPNSNGPRVRTKNGGLIGTTHTLANGETVYAFLGVPFAAPPVGPFRFEEARPVKPWLGYRDASKPSKFCVQFTFQTSLPKLDGEEDCLYLDIYTPRVGTYDILPNENRNNNKELKNVMVYIFGGEFSNGSCQRLAPDYILQDILFICLNYRPGPIGFFSSGDEIMPGNNGLKDQLAGLRWIQENIHNFGGDRNQVTLYGASDGAASVQYLLLSPQSKGLFKNAIMSSGSSLMPWALRQSTVELSKRLASSLQCPTFDSRLMLSCLKKKPIERLFEAAHQFYNKPYLSLMPFTPVVEAETRGAVFYEHPYERLKKGFVTDVPVMVGTVETEGSPLIGMLYDKGLLAELNNKWNELAPRMLHYDHVKDSNRRDRISFAVRDHYFGQKAISTETRKEMLKLLGDRLFTNGIILSTKLHSAAISENTYCWKLYYRGTGSFCDHHPDPVKKNYGVCHADEQFYLVRFTDEDNSKSKVDLDMVQLGTLSIITFMRTGNPNVPDLGEVWQPLYKNGTMNCLNVYTYTHQKMLDIEDPATTKFWRDVLQSEY